MILKAIPGFPLYFAGDDGEIYSLNYRWRKLGEGPRKLKFGKQVNGYKLVNLPENGKFKCQRVHVLVCTAFHGIRPMGMYCSHLDDNRENNRPENLIWETPSKNTLRMFENGKGKLGSQVKNSIFKRKKRSK